MDQTARRHLARLALTAAYAALPFAGIGCEKPQRQADKKADLAIAQSEIAAGKEGNEAKAYKLLTQAAQQADASEAERSHAKTLVAQADYGWVIKHMPELAEAEAKAAEIIDEIAVLGQRIAADNLLIEQCKAADPAGVAPSHPAAELNKSKAKYTAMAADLDKKILDAEARVRAKGADIDALTKQQGIASDEAGLLFEKSEQAKGQASLDLFKQYADARAKADGLTLATNAAKAQLANLQGAVAELKTQKQLAVNAAAAAVRQATELSTAWTKAQQMMQTTASHSKAIVGSQDGVAGKAKVLAAALAAAAEKRRELDARLQSSINAFSEAAKASDAVSTAMGQRLRDAALDSVERMAWKRMEKLHNFAIHRLDRAHVLMARGGMFVAQKSLLESKLRMAQNLAAAYKQAGLGAPAELSGAAIRKEVDDAGKTAQKCFEEADGLLVDISERGQAEDKSQANFPRIGTQYSLYNLTGKEKYLTDARAILEEMVKSSADESGKVAKVIPVLPAELETGIVKRAAVDLTAAAKPRVGGAAANAGRGTGKEAATWQKMVVRGLGMGAMPGGGGPVETQPTAPDNTTPPAGGQ